MTEAEWLACTDAVPMLEFLRGQVSDRKLRLILCGWSHLDWKEMSEQGRSAVEVAERFADGFVSDADREAADVQLLLASQGRLVTRRHWLARLTLAQGMDVWPALNDSASRNPRVRNAEVSIINPHFPDEPRLSA
jgi:hypothetical protein